MSNFSYIEFTNKANLTKQKIISMKNVFSPFSLICSLSLLLFSCTNDKADNHISKNREEKVVKSVGQSTQKTQKQYPAHDIYAQAAVETCNCLHPMFEKAEQTDSLMKDNQWTKVKQISEEVDKLRPLVEVCSLEIRRKYGTMESPRDQKKMLEALTEYCPESAALLRKTLTMHVKH
jgi:hypothetical protein